MIRLTKDKMILITDWYGPDHNDYEEREVSFLHPFLNEVVELSDDFTLEDLFYWIERSRDHFDLIFCSQLGHNPLQLYIDEIEKPGPEKDDEIDYLGIHRWGEYFEGDIELWIDFGGINEKTGCGYAIAFTPLNEIKHIPLRLNKTFRITDIRIPSRWVRFLLRWLRKLGVSLKWQNPYEYVYVSGTTCFTVYELISAVLYEISFVGSPEERDKMWGEVKKDVDEMRKCAELGEMDKK